MFGLVWPGVSPGKGAGALNVLQGLCGVTAREVWPCRRAGRLQLGLGLPLNGMLSRLSSGPDRGTVRGPGWGRPSKPCWPLGPSENRFLACSPQHCPAPSQPEAVVIAKPSAMETIVQPGSRLPGEKAACQLGVPAVASLCSPPVLPVALLCLACAPLDPEVPLLQGNPQTLSPLSCQEAGPAGPCLGSDCCLAAPGSS